MVFQELLMLLTQNYLLGCKVENVLLNSSPVNQSWLTHRAISTKSLSVALSQNTQLRKLSSPQEIKHPGQAKIKILTAPNQEGSKLKTSAEQMHHHVKAKLLVKLVGLCRVIQGKNMIERMEWATFLQQA